MKPHAPPFRLREVVFQNYPLADTSSPGCTSLHAFLRSCDKGKFANLIISLVAAFILSDMELYCLSHETRNLGHYSAF